MRIENLLNSPVDVQTSAGPIVLGPREARDVPGLHPSYEPLYRASSFFSVMDSEVEEAAPDAFANVIAQSNDMAVEKARQESTLHKRGRPRKAAQ